MLKLALLFFMTLTVFISCGNDDATDAMSALEDILNPETADLDVGGTVYANQCQRCHGTNGMGAGATTPVSRNITNADAARIQNFVRTGPGSMPTFTTNDISNEDLNNLIAFILDQWPDN